jgi:hypothetical protein
MTPSPELQAWLDQREKHLEVKQRIADAGGHMMLRSESYDPDVLDEPLRSEAKAYFDYRRKTE